MGIHTTCVVCNKGLDIEDGYLCNVCKNYVHTECFDDEAGMCNSCSEEMDNE